MAKGAPTSIGYNTSGMSKLCDARKKCASPIKGGNTEHTMMAVTGAGSSKPGAPTKNARKLQPKPKGDSGFEITMMGKRGK